MLRQLQFSVANRIDSESLPVILGRWTDEVGQIPDEEARAPWRSCAAPVAHQQESAGSLRSKLAAIGTLSKLKGEAADVAEEYGRQFIAESNSALDGIPQARRVPSSTSRFRRLLCAA